jgi:hypothetical protein
MLVCLEHFQTIITQSAEIVAALTEAWTCMIDTNLIGHIVNLNYPGFAYDISEGTRGGVLQE